MGTGLWHKSAKSCPIFTKSSVKRNKLGVRLICRSSNTAWHLVLLCGYADCNNKKIIANAAQTEYLIKFLMWNHRAELLVTSDQILRSWIGLI